MRAKLTGSVAAGCVIAAALFGSSVTVAHATPTTPESRASSDKSSSESFTLNNATDLGSGLVEISPDELDALIDSADQAEGTPILVDSESRTMLGFAVDPTAPQDDQLGDLVTQSLSNNPELAHKEMLLLLNDMNALRKASQTSRPTFAASG